MKKPLYNPILLAASTSALSLAALLSTAQSLPTRAAIDQNRLQGYWEGTGAGGKCSITIKDNTLRYLAGTNWHEATFTLPLGTNPQQLHATLKDSWPTAKDSIGSVVHAIIKLEEKTLTLATVDINELPPKTFETIDAGNKYVVTQVQPKKENANPPKTK